MNRIEVIKNAIRIQRERGNNKLASIIEAEMNKTPEAWLLASSDNEEEEEEELENEVV